MSPETNANERQSISPVCPHCNVEPCILAGHMVMMGGMPFVEVMCSQCRKIISVNIIPPPPMQEQPRPNSPSIYIPH